jgi:hypothetical protein
MGRRRQHLGNTFLAAWTLWGLGCVRVDGEESVGLECLHRIGLEVTKPCDLGTPLQCCDLTWVSDEAGARCVAEAFGLPVGETLTRFTQQDEIWLVELIGKSNCESAQGFGHIYSCLFSITTDGEWLTSYQEGTYDVECAAHYEDP